MIQKLAIELKIFSKILEQMGLINMRIVLTNDDGIFSEGLRTLLQKLDKEHEVYVFAPDRERSATGHAITLHQPLRANKVEFRDIDAQCWSIDGTPSDCVKLGVEGILEELPDLVISGINKGPNLGTDVLYSGTVSAALEGMLLGVQSMAISLATHQSWDFSYAADFALQMVNWIEEHPFKKVGLLNVNVPALSKEEIAGVNITKLGRRSYTNSFERRVDPRGRVYYWIAGEIVDDLEEPGTDVLAIKNNQISITPISINLTDYDVLNELQKVKFEL